MRFDPTKVLLDPYGRGVGVPAGYSRDAAQREGDNAATAMKSVVVDPGAYDWEGDAPLRRPSAQTIVYEMHVRGFTRPASSGVPEKTRGTFAGLIEKIPYLRDLGITAVDLLPVFQFDAQDCPPGLVNYWGYSPVSFFAPHQAYSSRLARLGPIDEFRDMFRPMHRQRMELMLDVVSTLTAEGGHGGLTLSFRGLDNVTYYILERDRSRYANYTGTGNTLNANQPIVRRMIVDSLRYWVEAMHVDGFRFDLAAVLSRDASGQPMPNPPVLWDIESDPVLAGTKLIAEAWDAAGLYQVGSFVGDSWQEWNGRFRDDVRSFFRGEQGSVVRVADRLIGMPMILMGDEVRRAQRGNNNAYCQDNETSWFDWTLVATHADVHRFVALLNGRRLLREVEPERQPVSLDQLLRDAHRAWHGVKLDQPDWGDSSHSLAFTAKIRSRQLVVHLILNAYWEPLDFELPSMGDEARDPWRRWIATTLDSPDDIGLWQTALRVPGFTYRAEAHSVVVLFANIGTP